MFIEPILKFILEVIKLFYFKKIYRHKLSSKKESRADTELFKVGIYYPPTQSSGWERLPQLRKWGCYFFSLLFIAHLIKRHCKGNVVSWERSDIELIFKGLSSASIVKDKAFIRDPQRLLNELGCKSYIEFVGVKEPYREYSKSDILVVQYDYGKDSHFVVAKGSGEVIFDSLGLSLVRSKGKPVSVRRFKIKNKNLIDAIDKI